MWREAMGRILWLAMLCLLLAATSVEARGPPPQLHAIEPGNGPTEGGTEVVVTGKHLTEASSVRFGQVDAAFEVEADDRLVTTSPPHGAGVVQLTVTTPGGARSIDFEYLPPAPVIDSIAPGQGSTAGGEQVTLRGSSLGAVTQVRFGAVGAAAVEVVGDDEVRATTPAHAAGTVDLRIETPGGAATASFTFVAPPPSIAAVDPAEAPTSGGTDVTVTGSGLTGTTAVWFGSAQATAFEVVDDNTVRATTPTHPAAVVQLRIETPNGSAQHDFTFVGAASDGGAVVIEAITPNSGSAEGGTQITITGSGLQNVTRLTFGGADAASWTIESDVRIVAVTPPHAAGTVQVVLEHPGGTATAAFTYEAPPDQQEPAGSGTSPGGGGGPSGGTSGGQEEIQGAAEDPVRTSAPAHVVGSGAPGSDGVGACWVMLAPSTPGQRIVVPFSPACEVEAVVVRVPDTAGLLNISVRKMAELPDAVPAPGIVHGPGLVFEAVIRDMGGQQITPAGAVLQVRMPGSWLEECPPRSCATDLFHYDGLVWSVHPMRAMDRTEQFLIMQADVPSFSLFAVGGTPVAWPDDSASAWPWAWLLGGVAMVAAPAAVTVWRSRPTKPDDPKVGMLLREMSDKEELLQFLHNAAHDLANPLTPIQLQLDLLAHAADRTDPEEQRKALRLVQRNVDQMTMLINDLRDAAKVRSGRLRFFPAEHALDEVLAEAVAMMELQATQDGITLLYPATTQALPVRIDRGRILQVVTNLLGNAIKFTPNGGRVEVSVEVEGRIARIRVTDTGRGMGPEDQAKLFEPFSQAHGDAEKAKGTGLGLYIARGIVEAHDGTIGCHSDGPGTGSTFWFTLPLQAASGGQKA